MTVRIPEADVEGVEAPAVDEEGSEGHRVADVRVDALRSE